MKVAVIIPCLNEEATIAKVVHDCRRHLPGAAVYVFDNGSDDATSARAEKAGAHVVSSPARGKGNVLRHAFRVVDADFVVMVDGDGTYPMEQAPRLIQLAKSERFEMVMGARLQLGDPAAFRPLHYAGNRFFSALVRTLFNYPVQDLLTGFRVFSRHFVRNVRFVSREFEVETEMTIRALAQNMDFCEVPIPYSERPGGSRSKLKTFRDGWKILGTIFRLWRHFRPLRFYSVLAAVFFATTYFSWLWPGTGRFFAFSGALFLALGFFLESRLESERFRLSLRRQARRKKTLARKKSA